MNVLPKIKRMALAASCMALASGGLPAVAHAAEASAAITDCP